MTNFLVDGSAIPLTDDSGNFLVDDGLTLYTLSLGAGVDTLSGKTVNFTYLNRTGLRFIRHLRNN
jgi:hypothetical protein